MSGSFTVRRGRDFSAVLGGGRRREVSHAVQQLPLRSGTSYTPSSEQNACCPLPHAPDSSNARGMGNTEQRPVQA